MFQVTFIDHRGLLRSIFAKSLEFESLPPEDFVGIVGLIVAKQSAGGSRLYQSMETRVEVTKLKDI